MLTSNAILQTHTSLKCIDLFISLLMLLNANACIINSSECMVCSILQFHLLTNRLNPSHEWNRTKSKRSHCNVEIDDSLLFIKLDECRLHANVGHIYGAREEEKHSQARKQETQHHWQANVQLTVKTQVCSLVTYNDLL